MFEGGDFRFEFREDAHGFNLGAGLVVDVGSHVGVEDVESDEHEGDEDGEDSVFGGECGLECVDKAQEPVVGLAHGFDVGFFGEEVHFTGYDLRGCRAVAGRMWVSGLFAAWVDGDVFLRLGAVGDVAVFDDEAGAIFADDDAVFL